MFALEIDFHDGVSPPEVLLVRRAQAIIGSSESAHVVIEGAASGLCELRISRGLGREFRCQPVKKAAMSQLVPQFLEGAYPGEAELSLGEVTTHITSLDIDLRLLPDQSPNRAGIKILRKALARPTPIFPAVALLGQVPVFLSFPAEQPLIIGRSRICGLRLDAADISNEHARLGFDQGQLWIEDLDSTNGTYLVTDSDYERITERVVLQPGQRVALGEEHVIVGIAGPEDLATLNTGLEKVAPEIDNRNYPRLVSTSELVRPAEFILEPEVKISVGREPANDIWVGAPHISRHHSELVLKSSGRVEIIDHSSNGTFVDGRRLEALAPTELPQGHSVIDFGGGVTVGVCYSADDEERFRNVGSNANGDSRQEKTDQKVKQNGGAFVRDRPSGSALETYAGNFSEDVATGFFPSQAGGEGIESALSGAGVFNRLAERETSRRSDSGISAKQLENLPMSAPDEPPPFEPRARRPSDLADIIGSELTSRVGLGTQAGARDFGKADEAEYAELLDIPRAGWFGRTLLLVGVIGLIIVIGGGVWFFLGGFR